MRASQILRTAVRPVTPPVLTPEIRGRITAALGKVNESQEEAEEALGNLELLGLLLEGYSGPPLDGEWVGRVGAMLRATEVTLGKALADTCNHYDRALDPVRELVKASAGNEQSHAGPAAASGGVA